MARVRKTALSFGVLAALAAAMSCRDPTQITVRITTGEKCSDLSGVQIVVGPSAAETQQRFEQHFTTAVTSDCDPHGLVGTLVVTPGGDGGTIVIATGVQVGGALAPDPTACADPRTAMSCIIARRSFSFIDHTSLTLPIDLDPLCIGRSCDATSTCFRGACVSDVVTCDGADCGIAQEHGPNGGVGSGNEAGSSDGAYDADLDALVSFEDVTHVDSGNDGGQGTDTGVDSGVPFCAGGGPSSDCNQTNGRVTPISAGVYECDCTCPTGSHLIVSCGVSMSDMTCSTSCPFSP